MKTLVFAPFDATVGDGKRIRSSRLERRSALPTSAACVVANGIRETLSCLLGTTAAVSLFEPVIPDGDGWQSIVNGAMLYRVRGNVADAALILRPADATALVGALFGESTNRPPHIRPLSPIESTVIDRTANALAANFGAICGARETYPVERVGAIANFISFFELLVEKPVEARIGIALSRDPVSEPRGALDVAHLSDVRISAVASLRLGTVPASSLAGLTVGTIFPIAPAALRNCTLASDGHRLVGGACGVRNGRYAISAASHERE